MANDDARFSRSSEPQHFLGKCDAELAVAMPETMKLDLEAAAHLEGTTGSGLLRRLASDYLYGRLTQVKRMLER